MSCVAVTFVFLRLLGSKLKKRRGGMLWRCKFFQAMPFPGFVLVNPDMFFSFRRTNWSKGFLSDFVSELVDQKSTKMFSHS